MYCGLLIYKYKMRTVNFGQLTIIGTVFDQGLCNMDSTVSFYVTLGYGVITVLNVTTDCWLSEKCELETVD